MKSIVIRKVRKKEVARCARMAQTRELEMGSNAFPTQSEFKAGRKAVFYVSLSKTRLSASCWVIS